MSAARNRATSGQKGGASSVAATSPSSPPPSAHLVSLVSLLLVSLFTLAFLGVHLALQYPVHDHHANDGFYTQGVAMLNSFPKDSIVLLNGDLNNNLAKYPQQCEQVRPDLSLLSLQLMSWDWFVPMQRANYPNVIFPGVRYHLTTPRSFTLRRFLDVNFQSNKKLARPPGADADADSDAADDGTRGTGGIFLCGPFKEGDHSNTRTVDPPTRYYEEHPFGLCSQLLPYGVQPANLTAHLRRGWAGLPRLSRLPTFHAWKYGEETWERVMYSDNLQRLAYLTSVASFNSNKQMGDLALLKVAYDLTEEMRRHERLLVDFRLMNEYEYRSAGVIYGLWSKHLYTQPGRHAEAEAAARRLYDAWRKYLTMKPDDTELRPAIEGRFNPYAGRPIVGIEHEEEDDHQRTENTRTGTTRSEQTKTTPQTKQQQQGKKSSVSAQEPSKKEAPKKKTDTKQQQPTKKK